MSGVRTGLRMIVEVEAVQEILPVHLAQTISYLKANDLLLALIIDFRVAKLSDGVKRVVWTGI